MSNRSGRALPKAVILAALLAGCVSTAPQPSGATVVAPTLRPTAETSPTPATQNLALGRSARASTSLSGQRPPMAIDGNAETVWGAGAHPTQWIEIDLGSAFDLQVIRLTVSQFPSGQTVHRIWAGMQPGPTTLIHEFRGETEDGDVLEVTHPIAWQGVRYVRIETTESPSWVAWREIELLGRPSLASEAAADVILKNAVVLTMDDARPRAEAVAIAGDTILAVGSNAEVVALAGPRTEIVDLEGLTVTPGFIDAHTHRLGDLGMLGVGSIEEAIEGGIQLGWTSLHELTVNQERLAALRALDREGRLRLRVTGYLQASWEDAVFDWYKQEVPHEIVSPYLRFPGVKLRADQEWGEWVYFDPATMARLVAEAHDLGWQVAVHSFAPQSNDMVLAAFEAALGGQPGDAYRFRLEHTGVVTDEQLDRMLRLGVIASVPTAGAQFYAEDETFQKYIPAELQPFTVRTVDFLEAGVRTAGHTDVPWSSFDWRNGVRPTHSGSAMWAIQSAVTRQDPYSPRPLADWELAQRVSVDQALHLHTIYAAYASFDEERLGSLEPGKLADLVILSANPLEVALEGISDIEVLMTMIGGRVEFCSTGSQAVCP